MNVLLMTDLEGASLVDSADMMEEDGPGYSFAVQRLMQDINAAVEGALAGGASRVFVVDGHHQGKNFAGGLHPKAEQLDLIAWKESVRNGQIQRYMEVGCHAMPGTKDGFLDHVQDSRDWFSYTVNGIPCGEIAQGALFVGAFGIPFTMVSGDDAACKEASDFLGDSLATAAVKTGRGRNQASCLPPDEAWDAIFQAAKAGCQNDVAPYRLPMPLTVELTLVRSDICDRYAAVLGGRVERLDGRTLRKIVPIITDYNDILFRW